MFDNKRYATNYIQQALMRQAIEPPVSERAGDNIDALKAIYEAHKQGGAKSARTAWEVLRKAVPHLDVKQKLYNFNDLHLIERPRYALEYDENGTAPPYAIYLTGLNALYGQPGSGKTFVAIDASKRIALAYPDRAVIISAGEGTAGLRGRSDAWDKHFGAKTDNLYLWDEAVPLLNPEAVEEFIAYVEQLNPAFIVIDTLARAMAGENENDTSIMSKFISATEDLMHRLRCGVLLIHHTGRAGYIRGSSVLDGACDSMLKLKSDDNIITVYNSLEHGGKNKHNPEINAIRLQILPVDIDIDGEIFPEAVVIPSEQIIDEIVDELSDNQRIIMEFIFDIDDGVTSQKICDSVDIHRATVFRNLSRLVKAELITKDGTKDTYTLTSKGIKSLGI